MQDKPDQTLWDLAVIGGGPAGMMAAGRAAERGAKVILIEKNDGLGKKLLITGGGRCNVTNAEFDTHKLLAKFKENNKYLFSAFSQWSVKETLDFFNSHNMPTKVEAEQRVFPTSDRAQSVWDVLVEYIRANKVTVLSKTEVVGLEAESKKIIGLKLKGKKIIRAKSFILATGGKSHPETGSTGEGFEWLKSIGHTVIEPTASLVPIKLDMEKDSWVKKLQGVTLKDIKINKIKGKILFTHFGVSGPTILNMSAEIRELMKYGDVELSLDLLPHLDYSMLNTKLQEVLKGDSNKLFKNILSKIIPGAMAPIILELSDIKPETWSHSVTREERLRLVQLLKSIPLHVSGLLGTEKAIITSGGIKLDEVDFKTMQSRLYSNLYLVGDVLDIDRPSGGYSLQLCWTTGFVAGEHAGAHQ